MDIRDYAKLFRRRKYIIFLTSGLIFIFYLFMVFFNNPRIYTASSSIMLTQLSLRDRVLRFLSQLAPYTVDMDTQLQLMDSKKVAQRVSDILAAKEGKDKLVLSAEEVMGKKRIYQVGETNLIKIEIDDLTEKNAVAIASAYAIASCEENKSLANEEFKNAREYTETQLADYGKRMHKAEEALRLFNLKHGVIDFDNVVNSEADKLIDYKKEIENLAIEEKGRESLLNELKFKVNATDKYIITQNIIPNPERQNIENQIFTLENQLMELEEKYTDTHPKVVNLKNNIAKLKNKLETKVSKYITLPTTQPNPTFNYYFQQLAQEEMNNNFLQVKKNLLGSLSQQEDSKLYNLSKEQLEYVRLLREVKTTERVYNNLQDMLEQMRVSEVTKVGNAKVIDIPTSATERKRIDLQKIILSLIISILCGVGLGVVVEFLDDTIKTSHEVRRYLNLSVLGSIPKIVDPNSRIISNLDLKSPIAEAFHKVCFQLESACLDSGAKAILLTSTKAEEGKTTCASNLAISLAREGERVLLVDGDVRRPNIHRIFKLENTLGLTSILTNQIEANSLEEAVSFCLKPTDIERLSILTSGPMVANPVELLRSEKLREVIEVLKNKADFIIFDSSPVVAVIDPVIIASSLDGIILLFDASKIRRKEGLQAKQLITNLKLKILGVVLNNVIVEEEDYYYYYYSRYPAGARRKKSAYRKI